MPTSSGAFIQDRGTVMMQVGAFPTGYSNDSVYGYDDGVNKWISLELDSIISCRRAGIYANGSDMTSKLNTILSNSNVKGIKFDVKGGGAITISGTVTVPSGKYLIFEPGTYLSGVGTISGGIIHASFRDKIFDTTLTISPTALSLGKWSVRWFGAVGDGSTDDQPAIQKTIDTAIVSGLRYVYAPGGTYKVGKGILIRKGTGQFITGFVFEGDINAYDGLTGQTKFTTANNATFVIGVHKGKGVRIRNIYVAGANTAINSLSLYDVLENPNTDFTGGCRNNTTSPHAGFIVDPFVNDDSYPTLERYPDFTQYYLSAEGNGGSTDVIFENCRVTTCVVGYCFSPHTTPQNGDACAINNCWGDSCKAAISIGQSQNRSIYVNNFKCWGFTETVFDCASYANGTADNPEVDGLNIAGSVRYLCRLSGYVTKGLQIRRAHIENLYSLGGYFTGILGGDLVIQDSWINFIDSAAFGTLGSFTIHDPYTLFSGGNLIFKNSVISKYANPTYIRSLCFTAFSVVFDNCTLDTLAVNRYVSLARGQITYINCSGLGSGLGAANFGTSEMVTIPDAINLGAQLFLFLSNSEVSYTKVRNPALPAGVHSSYVRKSKQRINSSNIYLTRELQFIPLSASQLQFTNIDANALTADVTIGVGNDYNKVQIGDQVYLNGTTLIPDEFGRTNIFLNVGIITSKNGTDTITLSHTGRGIATSTNYNFYITRYPSLYPWLMVGDCTSGSNVIANVVTESNGIMAPISGTSINSPYFPEGTYIVSVSGSNITVSNNATVSVNNIELICADWQGVEYGAVNTANNNHRGYKVGDIIYNTDFVNFSTIYKWRCTQAGITGTARLPVFSSEAL